MSAYVALKQIVYPPSHETVCVGSCRSFVALGDCHGTVWMLHPVSLSVLSQLTLQGNDGQNEGIQRISVSPDEQLLACITSIGDVTVLQVSGGRVVSRVQEHREHSITSLVWRTDAADTRPTGLYVGDDAGLVTLVNVPKSKVAALFQTPCIRLLQLDSGITQLDYLDDQLVVSTYSATFICDTKQELFTQVGEKSRQGKFGSCLFYARNSSDQYQPQPGDIDGPASRCSPSHQLKHSIVEEEAKFAEETSEEGEEYAGLITSESRYIDSSVSFYLGEPIAKYSDPNKESTTASQETVEKRVVYHALDAVDSNGSAEEKSSLQLSTVNKHSGIKDTTASRSSIGSNADASTSPSQKRLSDLGQCGSRLLDEQLRVFSGRPKSRVWEADLAGKVIRTHQLAAALAVTPLPVYDLRQDGKLCADSNSCQELLELSSCNTGKRDTKEANDAAVGENGTVKDEGTENRNSNSDDGEDNISDMDPSKLSVKDTSEPLFLVFNQVLRFHSKYLLLVCSRGVYGIDPSTSTVMFFLQVSVLGEVSVSGNSLLLSSVSGEVMRVSIVPPEVAVLSLHTLRLFRSCAHLAARHLSLFQHSEVLARVKKVVIRDIMGVVDDPSLIDSLEALKNDTSLHPRVNAQYNSINNTNIVGGYDVLIRERVKPLNLTAQSCPATPPTKRTAKPSVRQPSSTGYHTPSSGHYSRPLFGFRGYGGSVPPPAEGVEPGGSMLQDLVDSVSSNVTSSLLAAVTTKLAAVASQTRGLHETSRALAGNFRGGLVKKERSTDHDQTSNEKTASSTVSNVASAQSGVSSPKCVSNFQIKDVGSDESLNKSNKSLDLINDLNVVSNNSTHFESDLMEREENCLIGHVNDSDTVVDKFEELIVERKPRRRNKKIVSHKDKRKGLSNGHKHLQNVDENCDESREDSNIITTTVENTFLNFARLVAKVELNVSGLKTDPSKVLLLSSWLKEYVRMLSVLTRSKASIGDQTMDQFIQTCFDNSASRIVSSKNFKQSITTLLSYCLEYRNSLELPKLDSVLTLPEVFSCHHHTVTSEYDRKLDSFFTTLLSNSFDLVNYESILNSLSSLGLDYSPRLWLVLMSRVTAESTIGPAKGDFILDLFESLDFNRSQKLVFFRHYVEASQLETLVVAAVKLHHPSVVLDLLLISKYFSFMKQLKKATSKECYEKSDPMSTIATEDASPPSCDTLEPDDLLYTYLLALSKHYSLVSLYVKHWCGSRELQHDLVRCILHKLFPSSRSCTCGAALPNSPCCCSTASSLPLTSLLSAIVRGVVYDPPLLADLCHQHCYWSGYYSLSLRYQLSPALHLLSSGVLQTGCSNTLGLFFEALDHQHASELFTTLATMAEGATSTNQFRCGKCQELVTLPSADGPGIRSEPDDVTGSHLPSGEALSLAESNVFRKHKDSNEDGSLDCCPSNAPLLESLWLRAVQWSLGRVGGRVTMQLLQRHVTHRLHPPHTLPPQVYRMCLLCTATEQHTSSHRRSLLATACNNPILPLKEERHLLTLSVESPDLASTLRSGVSGLNTFFSDDVPSSAASPVRRGKPPHTTALATAAPPYGLVVNTRAGHCGLCQLPMSAQSMLTPSLRLSGVGNRETESDQMDGLSVFRCGHAYHAVCLKSHGHKCPKNCFRENLPRNCRFRD